MDPYQGSFPWKTPESRKVEKPRAMISEAESKMNHQVLLKIIATEVSVVGTPLAECSGKVFTGLKIFHCGAAFSGKR